MCYLLCPKIFYYFNCVFEFYMVILIVLNDCFKFFCQCFENVFTCSIDIIDDRTCRHSNTCPRNYLLSPKVIVIFEQRIELIVPKFMSPNETNSFNQYEKASEFTIRIL